MTATLVCDAPRMALWRRKMPTAVIVHSDRGSQYCSHDYQRLIASHKLRSSMSANGYISPEAFEAKKSLNFVSVKAGQDQTLAVAAKIKLPRTVNPPSGGFTVQQFLQWSEPNFDVSNSHPPFEALTQRN